jgi:hypothetical protein
MESLLSILPSALINANFTSEVILNDQPYEWEIYFVNSTGIVLGVPSTALKELSIEETLASWVCQGSITVNFDNDLAESYNSFFFRNDGEDLIRIRLIPKESSSGSLPKLNITKKMWELNYIFSIYDIQDVSPQTRGSTDSSTVTRLKKFLFWDTRYQLLLSRNLQYSTAESTEAGINSGIGIFQTENDFYRDENRSIPTDIALDEIIKKAFNNDPILSATGKDVDTNENWDTGATKLFYTSGARENAYEDLSYVYGRHVSSEFENDVSLLTIEHNEGGIGFFALKPLSRYFANAGSSEPGKYQIEHLFFRSDIQSTDSSIGKYYRAPILRDGGSGKVYNDMQKDIKINDFNIIDKYEFVDISPVVNTTNFISRPVHSFDFKNRTYNIDFEKNSLQNAEQKITNQYVKKLYSGRSSGENNFLLKTNTPTKVINSNVQPVYSLYGDTETPESRIPDGLHKILKTGLFQNTCINFLVPGLTFRTPGTFIGIDRLNGSTENSLDDKLCGQWFVINVRHIIRAGMYYNDITAIKIHRYNAIAFNLYTPPSDFRLDGTRGPSSNTSLNSFINFKL